MSGFNLQIQGIKELKSDFKRGANQVPKEVRWAMVQSVNAVKNTAQRLAPYKTGTLRRSIFTDIQDNGFKGVVAQDHNIASYGIDIEFGTKPHDIYPSGKKALFWKGALYPVRRVRHPGTSAQPFMEPGLEQNIDNIIKYFSDALGKVIQVIAS